MLSALSIPDTHLYFKIQDRSIASDQYIAFLSQIMAEHPSPIVLLADHVSFHRSKKVRQFVKDHRHQIRVFFLPKHAPQLNPDEQVWNEVKHRNLGREPIVNKSDLKVRLIANLEALQTNITRITSFFNLKDTKYTLNLTPEIA